MFKKKGLFDGIAVSIDSKTGTELPVRYYISEMAVSYFDAELETLKAWMPSPHLHPIRKNSKLGILCIITTNCKHTSIGSFSSVAIAVPVTKGKKPAAAMLPILFEESWPDRGLYIYKDAVTTSEAFSVHTNLWGYPEFLAEITQRGYQDTHYEVTVTEEQRIFSLRLKLPRYVRQERLDMKVYSDKQGVIFENQWLIDANVERSRTPEDTLFFPGEHPIGAQLKAMHVGPKSYETRFFTDMQMLKPISEKVVA